MITTLDKHVKIEDLHPKNGDLVLLLNDDLEISMMPLLLRFARFSGLDHSILSDIATLVREQNIRAHSRVPYERDFSDEGLGHHFIPVYHSGRGKLMDTTIVADNAWHLYPNNTGKKFTLPQIRRCSKVYGGNYVVDRIAIGRDSVAKVLSKEKGFDAHAKLVKTGLFSPYAAIFSIDPLDRFK